MENQQDIKLETITLGGGCFWRFETTGTTQEWSLSSCALLLCTGSCTLLMSVRQCRQLKGISKHVKQQSEEGKCGMRVLTFSEARAGFKNVMDDVCNDHEPVVITRVNGQHVVMLSMEDFNSMEETMHLLGSENNANRLRASIANLKAGKLINKEIELVSEAEQQTDRR